MNGSFHFKTRLNLTELLGRKAGNVLEFLEGIETVPGSSIYYHTHRFLQQHHFLSPEPPNDFAYWIANVLGEDNLAERLASIDTVKFQNIRSLRLQIIKTIRDYIEKYPLTTNKFANCEEEFHFMKSISFIIPTPYIAKDLNEFLEILKKITIDSIYFHTFEARLRLENDRNDFSNWLEKALGEKEIAQEFSRLDPYTYTLEDLRNRMIELIEKRMGI